MKKFILILCLCLITTNVFCETETIDGRWWNELNTKFGEDYGRLTKLDFVKGFSRGYISSLYYVWKNLKKQNMTKGADAVFKMENYPYDYNFGEIIDFIDKFYSNPQYKILKVDKVLIEIIFPALNKAWSQEQIDKKAVEILKESK